MRKKKTGPSGADLVIEKKPDLYQLSWKQMLQIVFVERLILKKQKTYEMADGKLIEPPEIVVHHLALVLDGKVVEILRAQDRLADIFLAQPEFVKFDTTDHVHVGTEYIDGQFIEPAEGPAAS